MIPTATNLIIVNDPEIPTRVLITADAVVLDDQVASPYYSIQVPVDLAVVGPGGLDIGPPGPNALYHLFLQHFHGGIVGIASLAPDFDFAALRVAAWPTGPGANWLRFVTRGKRSSALVHMSPFEGRFACTRKVGNANADPQVYAPVVFAGLPDNIQAVHGHALVTGSNFLRVAAVNPNNVSELCAIIAYHGGKPSQSMRLYYESPILVPRTVWIINDFAGDGVVINGWIDSANVT